MAIEETLPAALFSFFLIFQLNCQQSTYTHFHSAYFNFAFGHKLTISVLRILTVWSNNTREIAKLCIN